MRRLVSALLVALLLAATGCGPGEQPPLGDTAWRLTGWADTSPPPTNLTMTAEFGAGTVTGSAGINTFNGTFVSETDGSLTVRLGPMTLMGGPEADMQAESSYLARLGAARGYRIEGSTLVLSDADRKDSLTFTRA